MLASAENHSEYNEMISENSSENKDKWSRKKFNTIDEAMKLLSDSGIELLNENPWEPSINNPHLVNFIPKEWPDQLPEEKRKLLEEYFIIWEDKETHLHYLTAYVINIPSNENNTSNEGVDISNEPIQDEERGKVTFNSDDEYNEFAEYLSKDTLKKLEEMRKRKREEKKERVFNYQEIYSKYKDEFKEKIRRKEIHPARKQELASKEKEYICFEIDIPVEDLTSDQRQLLREYGTYIKGPNNTTEAYVWVFKNSINEGVD